MCVCSQASAVATCIALGDPVPVGSPVPDTHGTDDPADTVVRPSGPEDDVSETFCV